MTASEKSQMNHRNNDLILIGCNEEQIAQGMYIIDHTFRQCITHFIKSPVKENICNVFARTDALPHLHQAPTVPPTDAFIKMTVQDKDSYRFN